MKKSLTNGDWWLIALLMLIFLYLFGMLIEGAIYFGDPFIVFKLRY